MSSEETSKANVAVPSAEEAKSVSAASDNKISLSLDELKEFMKSTVKDVLDQSRLDETRRQAEEYNAKMAESVKASQAQLVKPNVKDAEWNLRYVKNVLEEDSRARFNSPEGKAYYNDKDPESFKKAKIKLLHHIGYEPEKIAEALEEII